MVYQTYQNYLQLNHKDFFSVWLFDVNVCFALSIFSEHSSLNPTFGVDMDVTLENEILGDLL